MSQPPSVPGTEERKKTANKKRQQRPMVVCGRCKGRGRIELTGRHAETFALLWEHRHKNGAELAAIAKCKPTAMNNRLKYLEKYKLAEGYRCGVEIRWIPRPFIVRCDI